MSRVGKKPITIPKGVEVKIEGRKVTVKGPKGTLEQEVAEGIQIEVTPEHVQLSIENNELSAFMGLYRSLINNMVVGTSEGFSKQLQLEGVGFKAAVQGQDLVVNVGYSHPCVCPLPEGIQAQVDKNVNITISGIDKQKVGQFAAYVRSKRPPEPYKGKGVRYKDEYVRRKAGKSGGK